MTGDILVDESDKKGKITRDLFNLNDYALVEQRKVVATYVMVMYKQFSVGELVGFIGKFESFIRAIYADLKNFDIYRSYAVHLPGS